MGLPIPMFMSILKKGKKPIYTLLQTFGKRIECLVIDSTRTLFLKTTTKWDLWVHTRALSNPVIFAFIPAGYFTQSRVIF